MRRGVIIILLPIIIISFFLRFFNLLHDYPYFFNPDERNMAIATANLRLPKNPKGFVSCLFNEFSRNNLSETKKQGKAGMNQQNCNLNPHFFAYGQFPLYLAFLSDQVAKTPFCSRNNQPVLNRDLACNKDVFATSFPSAIFWLRFYSAFSSILTVFLVYLISKKLFTYNLSLITTLAVAFSPGLIQSAHFGTTESLLTFFFLFSVYLSFSLIKPENIPIFSYLRKRLKIILLISLSIGLAFGSKLTGIFFLTPPGVAILLNILMLKKRQKSKALWKMTYILTGISIILLSTLFFVLSSPYNLIEKESFMGAVFGYEQDVATGKYDAFYTVQFKNTLPILFQMEKVFPYALGWPVFILGLLGFLTIIIRLSGKLSLFICHSIRYQVFRIRGKKVKLLFTPLDSYFIILTSSFLIYFLPNAFLYVKWTRFMTPIFPFFAIFSAVVIWRISKSIWCSRFFIICYLLSVICFILPGLSFFSIYTQEDSRLTASRWIYQNLPDGSYVLSETANVVDIPLGITDGLNEIVKKYTVISFDFYHMDENKEIYDSLFSHLAKSDYIFIPSRRIFYNYPRFPVKYPKVSSYYRALFSGSLGFEKMAEISSFPSLFNLSFADEQAEESFTVFDHPVIRIYKKVKPYTLEEYRKILTN